MRQPLSHGATLVAVTLAALFWGLYWVPIHLLEATGLHGTTAAFALTLGILPVLAWQWLRTGLRMSRRHLTGAVFIGVALSFYGAALNFTDVTRVVLLFYLSPAWSILIECRWFGRRWDALTVLALALFAAGLYAIIGPTTGFLSEVNPGDAMALVAGLAWSIGAAIVFSSAAPRPFDLALAAGACSVVVSGAVVLLDPGVTTWPEVNLPLAAVIAVISACCYVLPTNVATFYGAGRLAPATLTFLLSAEVVSGIASSSYWLGEPFTLAKTVGTLCIVAAVFAEVTNNRLKQAATPP